MGWKQFEELHLSFIDIPIVNVQVTCSAVGCVRSVCLKEPDASWIPSVPRPSSQHYDLCFLTKTC